VLKSAVYPMSTESQAQECERGMRAPRGIFITFGGQRSHGNSLRSCEKIGMIAGLADESVCAT
jgi:hypothetical protein